MPTPTRPGRPTSTGSPLPSSAPSSPRWRAAVPTWRSWRKSLFSTLGMGYRTQKKNINWWLGEGFYDRFMTDLPDSSQIYSFSQAEHSVRTFFFTISANMKLSLTRIYSNSWMIWVPTQARMDECFCSKILMQGSRAGWCWLLLWNTQFCWTGLFSYVSSFLRVHVLLLAYLSAHFEPKPGDVFPWPPVGTSW
jgi:hypothetical protein